MQSIFDPSVLATGVLTKIVLESETEQSMNENASNTADNNNPESSADDPDKRPQQVYHVHNALLTRASAYFQGLERFEGGKTQTVNLKDVSDTGFKHFANWLYTGQLLHDATHGQWNDLVEAYVVGDRLLAPGFKNCVMDAIKGLRLGEKATPAILAQLQNIGLPESAPLVQFAIHSIAYECAINNFENMQMDDDGRAFFMEGGSFAVALMKRISLVMSKTDMYIKLEVWDKPALTDPSDSKPELYHEPLNDD